MNSGIIWISIFSILMGCGIFFWRIFSFFPKDRYEKILVASGYIALGLAGLCAGYLGWIGYQDPPVKTSDEIVFVLDVSKSMNVEDIASGQNMYSRLDIAKKVIASLIEKYPNARYGLVLFAGESTSVLPLTYDKNTFLTFVSGVDNNNIVKQATNFSSALQGAYKRFSGDTEGKRHIVLLTDGGEDGDVNEKNLSFDSTFQYHIIGVGTPAGGNIPIGKDVFGTSLYKTQNGDYVISTLHKKNISHLADIFHSQPQFVEKQSDIGSIFMEHTFASHVGWQADMSKTWYMLCGIGAFVFYLWFVVVHFWKNALIYYISQIGKKFL